MSLSSVTSSDDAVASDSQGRRLGSRELIGLIALLMALNAAAIDVFIPALQDIGAALGVEDVNRRQWVISAYLLGFAVAQLFYGTLSDRFGRRPVLFVGLSIYVLGALAAVFAPTFGVLLALRAVEGVGAAATRVIAVSVVRDCFEGRRMASVMSLVMMVFLAMPVVAPSLGSAILVMGTWQELSAVVCLVGIIAFVWAWRRLPETLAVENRRPLEPQRVLEAFRQVLTTRVSAGYMLASATIFGALFGFVNQAEQVYTQVYDLGPAFTLYFSIAALCMAGASFANSRLVGRFGMRRLSHMALVTFAVLSAVHLFLIEVTGGALPLWAFTILMSVTFGMIGFVGTNFNALAMDPLGRIAGTASSVLGAVQMLGGGLFGAAIGYAYDGTLEPLLIGFLALSLVSLGFTLVAERGRLFDRVHKPAPSVS